MEWLNLAAFIVSALSFLGLCWQVLRAETAMPSAALNVEWDDRGLIWEGGLNGWRLDMMMRPAFGFVFHDAEIIETTDWPYERTRRLKRYERRVTEEGDPLRHVARFKRDDSVEFIVQVLSLSKVLHRRVARAWLVKVSDSGVVDNGIRCPNVSIRPWKWIPGVTILFGLNSLIRKTGCSARFPLGHWCRLKLDWQDHLPEGAFRRSRGSGACV